MDRQRIIESLNAVEVGKRQYKILKEIGRGGNGVAVLCNWDRNEEVVAKIYIPPDRRDLDQKALGEIRKRDRINRKTNAIGNCSISGIRCRNSRSLPPAVVFDAACSLELCAVKLESTQIHPKSKRNCECFCERATASHVFIRMVSSIAT